MKETEQKLRHAHTLTTMGSPPFSLWVLINTITLCACTHHKNHPSNPTPTKCLSKVAPSIPPSIPLPPCNSSTSLIPSETPLKYQPLHYPSLLPINKPQPTNRHQEPSNRSRSLPRAPRSPSPPTKQNTTHKSKSNHWLLPNPHSYQNIP